MNKRKMMTAVCGAVLGASLWGTTVFADQKHEVNAGESLWKISQQYDVSVSELKSWNNLSGNEIRVGQDLVVSNEGAEQSSNKSTYTVKNGDSLWKVATMHGMSIADLKEKNGLSKNWIQTGQELVVNGKATSASTPVSSTQSTILNTDSLIKEAKSHIGTPYLWAGTTPSGFDCSGFLNYAYEQEGVNLPRTVASIYAADNLETVSSSERQPGDLVFFETYKPGASHAGIYIGNNQFIHSSSSKGITISSLSSNYWSQRYIGSKQITN